MTSAESIVYEGLLQYFGDEWNGLSHSDRVLLVEDHLLSLYYNPSSLYSYRDSIGRGNLKDYADKARLARHVREGC